MGARIPKERRASMNEKETEWRIIIKTRNPHRVIDVLHDMIRVIQHEVLELDRGFITIEAGTYIEKEEKEPPKK